MKRGTTSCPWQQVRLPSSHRLPPYCVSVCYVCAILILWSSDAQTSGFPNSTLAEPKILSQPEPDHDVGEFNKVVTMVMRRERLCRRHQPRLRSSRRVGRFHPFRNRSKHRSVVLLPFRQRRFSSLVVHTRRHMFVDQTLCSSP